jgi:hypothetical protein
MSMNSTSFKVGRGAAFYMFVFLAVGGVLGGAGMAALREWLPAAAIFASGVLAAAICRWMPGVLTLDDSGIEIQRRSGSQRLRWDEIDQAVWSSSSGVASLASDNWVLTLNGKASGKKTTMILSGPMVERQKEARQLLEARFPLRQ